MYNKNHTNIFTLYKEISNFFILIYNKPNENYKLSAECSLPIISLHKIFQRRSNYNEDIHES